jgi:hypothetical protein
MKVFAIIAAALVLATAGAAPAADPQEILRRGKRATALVHVRAAGTVSTQGTAFCIDTSGYFLTTRSAAAIGGTTSRVALLLHAGEQDQTIVDATVIRQDKAADLVMLKLSQPVLNLTALELGSIADLEQARAATAFGFDPFSTANPVEQPPAVRVTGLSLKAPQPAAGGSPNLEFDPVLHPPNNGGPILDGAGRVVGVLGGGSPGNMLTSGYPVSRLAAFIDKPDMSIVPEAIALHKRSDPIEFTLAVARFNGSTPPYTVDLTLPGGPDKQRTIRATPAAAGVYKVTAPPLPPPDGPQRLAVRLLGSDGSIAGTTLDRQLSVGEKTFMLGTVARIAGGAAPSLTLREGERISGPITGGEVPLAIGGITVTVDLAGAAHVDVAPAEPTPGGIDYTLTVRSDDRLVGERSGVVPLVSTAGDPAGAGGSGGRIRPPALPAERAIVRLPGVVDDVVPAAGSRLLILRMNRLRMLGVFDVNAARVVRYVPLPAEDALITAGMEKMICASPAQKTLSRYSLGTFAREATVPLDVDAQIAGIVMGSASNGPVMLVTRAGHFLRDVETLGPFALAKPDWPWRASISSQQANYANASADGQTFAGWADVSPSGIRTMQLDRNVATCRSEHTSAGELVPSHDGSFLFTGNGVYSAMLRPLDEERFRGRLCLPSSHPDFFVCLAGGPARPGSAESTFRLDIHSTFDRRLLLTVPALDELSGAGHWNSAEPLRPSRRLHYLPDANLLITIPESRDSLTLRHVDLFAEMEKAGVDYFFVTSRPRLEATRGATYAYDVAVRSRRGGTEFTLDHAPAGMRISPHGRVTWDVPVDYPGNEAAVIIGLRDASGRQLYHSFTLGLP